MPGFLAPYRWLVYIALLVAAGLAVNAFLAYEQGLGYQKRVAEDAVQLNQDLMAAREDTARLFRLKDAAEIKGAEREQTLIAQSDAARHVSVGLRDDIEFYRRRLSDDSIEAARAYADAGLRLLGTCQERYRDLAERAQGHYSDVQTLSEAWPR